MIGRFLRAGFGLPLSVCGFRLASFGWLIPTMVPYSPCLGGAQLTISTRLLFCFVDQMPRMP